MKKIKSKEKALQWLKEHNARHLLCQYDFIDLTQDFLKTDFYLKRYMDFPFIIIIKGDIDIQYTETIDVPIYQVDGNVLLSKEIINLKNGPSKVNGDFLLDGSKLSSLKYGPYFVKGYLSLEYGELNSLQYAPQYIGKGLYLAYNNIKNLENFPLHVGGDIDFTANKLYSLEGLPKEIHGYLAIAGNELTSLQYCPEIIHGYFDCSHNHLANLKYCPKIIEGSFFFNDNIIHSLQYFPEKIQQDITMLNNYIHAIKDERNKKSNAGLLKFKPEEMDDLDFTYNMDCQQWFPIHHMEKSLLEKDAIEKNLDLQNNHCYKMIKKI